MLVMPTFAHRDGHCSDSDFSKRQTPAPGLVAWMSTNFVVYRLGLWWLNWKSPCSCLGNLTAALHISPQAADNIMKVLLACLLIGSYGLLIWRWRMDGRQVRDSTPHLPARRMQVSAPHLIRPAATFSPGRRRRVDG
jgi:hypothetical protein